MIDIAGHSIGPDHPTFIIAEAGVNHNGDIRLAERLIDAAARARCDAVKFQAFNTARICRTDSPMYRTLLPMELSEGQLRHLKACADDRGIMFLCTPDDEIDADFLEELVPAFKIGSANLRNLPLLRHVAGNGKPILLSTGMADMESVRQAVNAVEDAWPNQYPPLALLHCVSVYPTEEDASGGKQWWDPAAINLRAMDALSRFGYPVGFSDHSPLNSITLAAVARGACIIERHLRIEETRGPDRYISVLPHQLEDVVWQIRQIESALGDGVKRPMEAELETRNGIEGWRKG